jgi:Calcineurin-like phosphoesterase
LRTILHLSDLHFGRVDPTTLDPLVNAACEIRPDVVAISGDLTQRARRGQFRQAREFLDRLPGTPIVVPGNHDVPLYNVAARFLFSLSNYRRYISDDLEPFYSDGEIAVAGINTAHSRTFKSGRITRKQIVPMSAEATVFTVPSPPPRTSWATRSAMWRGSTAWTAASPPRSRKIPATRPCRSDPLAEPADGFRTTVIFRGGMRAAPQD